jgi:hypothetical protein
VFFAAKTAAGGLVKRVLMLTGKHGAGAGRLLAGIKLQSIQNETFEPMAGVTVPLVPMVKDPNRLFDIVALTIGQ